MEFDFSAFLCLCSLGPTVAFFKGSLSSSDGQCVDKNQTVFTSFQLCPTSAPEPFGYVVLTRVTNDLKDQEVEQMNEPQTSLHSRKEQKRRLQIKMSCQRLHQLLPFVSGPLDTATTLELTVKYISYLKEILPPHLLAKVIETVERDSNSSSNVQRKPAVLKNTTKKTRQAAKKSSHDRCLRRSCHQRILKKEILPMIIITNPPLMVPRTAAQTVVRASPTLLDKSTVPRGQMLPVCQNQSVANSFHCVQNNWADPTPPAQVDKDPALNMTPWNDTSKCDDHVALQPVALDQNSDPSVQNPASSHLISSEHTDVLDLDLFSSVPAEDFINQLLTSPAKFQNASPGWDDFISGSRTPPATEPLCDSRLFPESDFGISYSLTDVQCDAVSPCWLDLFCNDGLCFPETNPEDLPLTEIGFL